MDMIQKFEQEKIESIEQMGSDLKLKQMTQEWFDRSCEHKYSYNFTWMGRPIIQYPQDILAIQEIIWRTKPDIIIETGIAHGGSLIFSASMLELMGSGTVIGVDIDIRSHNRKEIEAHPMFKRIKMIQGSSIDPSIVDQVAKLIPANSRVMVVLDSNHTHDHVLQELYAYSKFVSKGAYLIVLDTVVEYMPDKFFVDKPWSKGNSPLTAVRQFLKENNQFALDKSIDNKILISAGLEGYLKRV